MRKFHFIGANSSLNAIVSDKNLCLISMSSIATETAITNFLRTGFHIIIFEIYIIKKTLDHRWAVPSVALSVPQ